MSDSSSTDNTGRFSCESYLMNTAVSSDRVKEGATKRSGPILWGLIISFTRFSPFISSYYHTSKDWAPLFPLGRCFFRSTNPNITWIRVYYHGNSLIPPQGAIRQCSVSGSLSYLFISQHSPLAFLFPFKTYAGIPERMRACISPAQRRTPNIFFSRPFFFPFLFYLALYLKAMSL